MHLPPHTGAADTKLLGKEEVMVVMGALIPFIVAESAAMLARGYAVGRA